MSTTKQLTEWCGKIARAVVVSAVMLTTATAFAAAGDTYVWTGAADALWSNPANWLVNDAVPGDYPKGGENIVFGPVAAGAATTISLAGASEFTTTPTATIGFRSVVFKAGAPAYTLGTTADADLVFDLTPSLQYVSKLEVESGVTTPQTIGCRIRAGGQGPTYTYMTQFNNNGTGLLSLNFSKTGMYNSYIVFSGDGDFSIDYANEAYFHLRQNGEMQIRGKPTIKALKAEATADQAHPRRVNILSGAQLSVFEYQNPRLEECTSLDIYGEGLLYLYEANVGAGYSFGFYIHDGNKTKTDFTVTTTTTIKNQNPASGYLIVRGGGTWALYGPASAESSAQSEFRIEGESTLAMTNIGAKASADSFLGRNVTNIVFTGTGMGTLLYKGPGETASQDLRLEAAAQATLRNGGTGTFVYGGAVFSTVAGSSLLLDAATAPIDFQATTPGPNVPAFAVTGAAGVTIPTALAADAALSLTGAKVSLTSAAESTVKLAFAGGANEVSMPAGVTTTVADFAAPAGGVRVDFVIPADTTVKLAGAAAGFLPDNVTVNGSRGKVLPDGSLAECVAKWASAVDGNWNETAKWSGKRLPDATDTAKVTASGASYTVSVTDGSADVVTELEVANATDGETATVGFSTDYRFGAGTTVKLDRGGVLGTTATDATLTFAPNVTLKINEGGAWKSSVGTNVWAANTADLVMDGGTLAMKGTSTLVLTNAAIIAAFPTQPWNRYLNFNIEAGEFVLSDDARMMTLEQINPVIQVLARSSERTATFTARDRAHVTADYSNGAILIGATAAGATGIFNHELETGATLEISGGNSIRALRCGVINGTGVFNLKSGAYGTVNNCTFVGYEGRDPYAKTGAAGHFPTGIVNQTGGSFSSGCYNAKSYNMLIGTTIGGGAHLNVANGASHYTGIWNLSGGTFGVGAGAFIIGAGPCGTGAFNLSGGTMTYSGATYFHPLLIGLGGGDGAFRQTGGSASVTLSDVCVGGCRQADLGYGTDWTYEYDANPSVGLLDLRGGTFTAAKRVIVGAHGRGTLAISGSASLVCAGLELANRTESVLSYTLASAKSQAWCAKVGALKIAAGSKLVIDANELSADSRSTVELLTADEIEGTFATQDVTIICDNPTDEQAAMLKGAKIVYERGGQKGLWLKMNGKGLVLTVR